MIQLLISVMIVATGNADSTWTQLIRAKNASHLQALAIQSKTSVESEKTCQNQLTADAWPTECFMVLEREVKSGNIEANRAQAARSALLSVCRRVAESHTSLSSLIKSRTQEDLSNCQSYYDQRRAELEYREIESAPSQVFNLRHF